MQGKGLRKGAHLPKAEDFCQPYVLLFCKSLSSSHTIICTKEDTLSGISLELGLRVQENSQREKRLELKRLLPEAGPVADESQTPFLS